MVLDSGLSGTDSLQRPGRLLSTNSLEPPSAIGLSTSVSASRVVTLRLLLPQIGVQLLPAYWLATQESCLVMVWFVLKSPLGEKFL